MELQEYIKLATRTESRIDKVVVNPNLLINLIYLFTASGHMLDQVKKHVFYGKEYDVNDFTLQYQRCDSALRGLNNIRVNGTSEEMGEEEEDINPRLFHAIIGIATESTEMCDAMFKVLAERKELDLVNTREEIGDMFWYMAIFYDTIRELGATDSWEDDLKRNINKLRKRYPDKFSQESALERNLDEERKELEFD